MKTPIDLRSDTVTRPTPAMREAMAKAEVGDDVYGEDPTINRLQDEVARLLGKEAALYVPTGTMSNQICVKVHTQPGDELICDSTCHIYIWEAGGPAVLSGVTTRTIDGTFGIIEPEQMEGKIRPGNEHYVRTRLVTLENTHNRGGGGVYPLPKIQAISQWAKKNGLATHLDGARLWNAHVASGIALKDWCDPFDSVSVCFSKGLGAPIGSALAGSKEFVAKARRVRKLFGGAIRQGGITAAGALYAVQNHIERLAEDHRNAATIGQAIQDHPYLQLVPNKVETNLIWFEIDTAWMPAPEFGARLKEKGIVIQVSGQKIMRICTHLDVSSEQAEYVANVIRSVK